MEFRIRLRRITWKRPPTRDEIELMTDMTFFGPSWFRRGNEWLFRYDEPFWMQAKTPPGWERVNA